MKAVEQHFQVVLFVFDNFAKWNYMIFYSVLNLALLGVKNLLDDSQPPNHLSILQQDLFDDTWCISFPDVPHGTGLRQHHDS